MSEAWTPVAETPPPPPRTERASSPRSSRPTTRRVGPPRSSRTPTGRAGGSTKKEKENAVDLTEKINGFLQGNVAGPLLGAGVVLRNRALIADSEVIAEHGPQLAEELNNLAQDNPQVAMILEKVTRMGPYGAILQVGLTIIGKILTNHRQQLLPITARIFGAKSLDETVGLQESLDEQISLMFARVSTTPNGSAGLRAND